MIPRSSLSDAFAFWQTERGGVTRHKQCVKTGKEARPHLGLGARGGGTSVRLEACSLSTVFLRVEPQACFPWGPHITPCLETEHLQEAAAFQKSSGLHRQPTECEELDTGNAPRGRGTPRKGAGKRPETTCCLLILLRVQAKRTRCRDHLNSNRATENS